jgi:hypothetical protein
MPEIEDFDPQEFIIPASDTRGHSTRIWNRIDPGTDRQISIIVNSKSFPYRSKGDLVRHAIHRHLHWLHDQAPFKSIMGQIDAIIELVREEEFNSEFVTTIEKLTEQAARYVTLSQLPRAKSLVMRVMDKIKGMPDGAWKDQYMNEIETRFSHLLSGQAVNLIQD